MSVLKLVALISNPFKQQALTKRTPNGRVAVGSYSEPVGALFYTGEKFITKGITAKANSYFAATYAMIKEFKDVTFEYRNTGKPATLCKRDKDASDSTAYFTVSGEKLSQSAIPFCTLTEEGYFEHFNTQIPIELQDFEYLFKDYYASHVKSIAKVKKANSVVREDTVKWMDNKTMYDLFTDHEQRIPVYIMEQLSNSNNLSVLCRLLDVNLGTTSIGVGAKHITLIETLIAKKDVRSSLIAGVTVPLGFVFHTDTQIYVPKLPKGTTNITGYTPAMVGYNRIPAHTNFVLTNLEAVIFLGNLYYNFTVTTEDKVPMTAYLNYFNRVFPVISCFIKTKSESMGKLTVLFDNTMQFNAVEGVSKTFLEDKFGHLRLLMVT